MNKIIRFLLPLVLSISMIFGIIFYNETNLKRNLAKIENKDISANKIEDRKVEESIKIMKEESLSLAKESLNLKDSMQKISLGVNRNYKASAVSRGINSRTNYLTLRLDSKSNLTKSELNKIVSSTNLRGIGEACLIAEHLYNVNALFIISLAQHESGNGNSKIAKYKNNLFGIGAYDKNPYKYAKTFESKEDCILYFANMIKKNYFDKRNRKTAQKIGQIYASDPAWATKLAKTMEKNYKKAKR